MSTEFDKHSLCNCKLKRNLPYTSTFPSQAYRIDGSPNPTLLFHVSKFTGRDENMFLLRKRTFVTKGKSNGILL